jgi:hypothetical protein
VAIVPQQGKGSLLRDTKTTPYLGKRKPLAARAIREFPAALEIDPNYAGAPLGLGFEWSGRGGAARAEGAAEDE